jgi:four helix bundle protein
MIPGELSERLLEFAAAVGQVADALPKTPFGQHVAGELIRSAAGAGPRYEEATSTERRVEFTEQLGDALRDLRAAQYWLRLIAKANLLPERRLEELVDGCSELCSILDQSVLSARARAWRDGQFGHWRATDLQFTIYGFPFATIAMGVRRQAPGEGGGGPAETKKP